MLFDFTAPKWLEAARLSAGYPSWSRDGKYIYVDGTLGAEKAFFRVRISDHKLEQGASLKDVRQAASPFGAWTGLAPDNSPLRLRDTGTRETYALDWQAP